jgi:hypothetical protein
MSQGLFSGYKKTFNISEKEKFTTLFTWELKISFTQKTSNVRKR